MMGVGGVPMNDQGEITLNLFFMVFLIYIEHIKKMIAF